MGHPAPTTDSAVDSSTRFLAELENLWTLLRVYGTEHPAFGRCAAAVAAALARPLRVSISPRGFTVGKTALAEPKLAVLAQRLRSMGLVGVAMDPGLTAAQARSLVLALDELDRSRAAGATAVEKIAAASGRRVTAVPLRLAGLRLVETNGQETPDGAEQTTVWRELFAAACSGGPGGAEAGELAQSFELALKAVASPEQWNAMVGVWARQLAAVDSGARGGAQGGGAIGAMRRAGAHGPGNAETLDAAAAFLGALSPHLCKRLLAETFNGAIAPQNVVMALAERLPKGVVLGALAAVDRTNGQPSAAALALLRKIASNLPGAGNPADAAPRTTDEMVEIATSLERLLGSDQEASFVPENYLQQRQELSGHALAPAAGRGVAYPDERETARHAAGLAFQMLSSPDTSAADLNSALAYLRNHTGDWIKAGQFELVTEGLTLARALCGHWDRSVARPALDLVAHAVTVEDLLEGSRQSKDRATAAEGIAGVLRQIDGAALARALTTLKPTPAGGHEAVFDALRKVLPMLGEDAVRDLCRAFKDATPAPALLSVLSALGSVDAVKAVAALVPHAAGAMRCAVVHVIFRHDFRWPMALTEQLLKDDLAEIRRLAVMKLVSGADLATAARIFQAATDRHGPFEADVALGLAELLHRHRHHPDVRAAYRQWTWSGRRWAALFSLSLADGSRAA